MPPKKQKANKKLNETNPSASLHMSQDISNLHPNDQSLFLKDNSGDFLKALNEDENQVEDASKQTKDILKSMRSAEQSKLLAQKYGDNQRIDDRICQVSLVCKVALKIYIERIISLPEFKFYYNCENCKFPSPYTEISTQISCKQCKYSHSLKFPQKSTMEPIHSEKNDQNPTNDLTTLVSFQTNLMGSISFDFLKFEISCSLCKNEQDVTMVVSTSSATTAKKNDIQSFTFNAQVICDKCCRLQVLSLTNLEVKYDWQG